jgi:hypothetical protein
VDALTPPLFIAGALLIIAGLPKVAQPASTSQALAGVGLPGREWMIRGLGTGEVLAGTAVLFVGGPWPALAVGLAYLGFAGFVMFARARGGAACGCLGSDDTPPTLIHVVIDVAAALVALLAATASPANLIQVIGEQPGFGVPMVVLLGLGLWFAYLTLTWLPRLTLEAGR